MRKIHPIFQDSLSFHSGYRTSPHTESEARQIVEEYMLFQKSLGKTIRKELEELHIEELFPRHRVDRVHILEDLLPVYREVGIPTIIVERFDSSYGVPRDFIVDGNHRTYAARRYLGMDMVPAFVIRIEGQIYDGPLYPFNKTIGQLELEEIDWTTDSEPVEEHSTLLPYMEDRDEDDFYDQDSGERPKLWTHPKDDYTEEV